MSCPAYRDSIVLFVDGELSEDAAHGVKAHLAGCAMCRGIAGELERLAAALAPAERGSVTMDETRFWRRFEADLAVRVARGETPWWKRSLVIPLPAVAGLALVVVCTGLVAGRYHRRAQTLEIKAQQLQAILREARESTVFPATVRVPKELDEETSIRTADVVVSGATTAAAAPLPEALVAPVRSLPASTLQVFPQGRQQNRPRTSIRFVDSDGVLQPGDLF